MKKVTSSLTLLLFCYLFSACQISISDQRNKNIVKKIKPPIDSLLLGVWENSSNNSDGPPNIRAIKFESNNDFIFYPALGYGDNRYRKGNYKIIGDTLLLHFTIKRSREEYLFEIFENELYIKPIINQYSHFSLTSSKDKKVFIKKKMLDTYYFGQFIEEF